MFRDHDLTAFLDLVQEGREVLAGFANAGGAHVKIVLHVAHRVKTNPELHLFGEARRYFAAPRGLQCSTMKSIGVCELRQRASEYLRHVKAGRALEITARGRPVAMLVPLRGTGHVERLIRRGRVIPPTGDLLDLGPPPKPGGKPRPGTVLARTRSRER